jgi:serine/threonine-protein kinase
MSDEPVKPMDSLIGITVDHGRYEIVKLIGEGGMGRVFQARQISMNRMVALKLLRAQLATDDHLLARFQQEAHAVSKLRHPNTITMYDYGKTEDGYLFIAMELLGGRSLASILSAEKRLEPKRMLHIMEQVTSAVAEAHQFGIVHRDLKPENIQIDRVANDPDFAKVLDFGIAKMVHGDTDGAEQRKTLTMAGAVFGTPHYMSPEQGHGQECDTRTDLYSLGVILYEMLSGEKPFTDANPMAIIYKHRHSPIPRLALALAPLQPVIDRLLAKLPDDRYASAAEAEEGLGLARLQLASAAA